MTPLLHGPNPQERRHRARARARAIAQLTSLNDEVEAGVLAACGVLDRHFEGRVVDAIGAVAGLTGEVELRREDRAVRRLDLHVDVPRAPRVEARDDGL